MKNKNTTVKTVIIPKGKFCGKCCANCRYWDSGSRNSRGEGKCGYKNVHTSASSHCNAWED